MCQGFYANKLLPLHLLLASSLQTWRRAPWHHLRTFVFAIFSHSVCEPRARFWSCEYSCLRISAGFALRIYIMLFGSSNVYLKDLQDGFYFFSID